MNHNTNAIPASIKVNGRRFIIIDTMPLHVDACIVTVMDSEGRKYRANLYKGGFDGWAGRRTPPAIRTLWQ